MNTNEPHAHKIAQDARELMHELMAALIEGAAACTHPTRTPAVAEALAVARHNVIDLELELSRRR